MDDRVAEADERIVDALGKPCPMPVILLARAIEEVDAGSVVAVLADDPAAEVDIPVWCRMKAQDYLGASDEAEGRSYRVRRRT